jgi:hypothetical protein
LSIIKSLRNILIAYKLLFGALCTGTVMQVKGIGGLVVQRLERWKNEQRKGYFQNEKNRDKR